MMTQQAGGGTSFTVDSAELGAHATDVSGIASDIEDAMDLMRRKLETLKGSWKGAAAGQYEVLHADWEAQQRNVKDALRDISRAAANASTTYARTEDDVRTSFMASA